MHLGGSTVGNGKQTMEVTRQADGAKKLEGKKNNQVTAALVGTRLPTVGKDTAHVLVKMWHERNRSNKVQEAMETILLNMLKR